MKPTRQEIENATDTQLNEWAAVWIKKWKFDTLKAKLSDPWKGDLYYLDEYNQPIIRYVDWNPAQNIGQAWEIRDKIKKWNYPDQARFIILLRELVRERMKTSTIFLSELFLSVEPRDIVQAALLAVMGE